MEINLTKQIKFVAFTAFSPPDTLPRAAYL